MDILLLAMGEHNFKRGNIMLCGYFGKKIVLAVAVAALVSGCVKMEERRGYVAEAKNFSKIEAGKTTREEVRKLLGSPSSKSTFGQETWYYIGMNMERTAFFVPDVAEQKVVQVEFADSGVVSNVHFPKTDRRRAIEFSNDSTPTEGNSVTVMEQLLGNLGRFNNQGGKP